MQRGAGRFAPSPTGPLHLGSLLTATASWLDARSRGDRWHVRIDDLDAPRNRPGAADDILRTLEGHGLWWDGPVSYQHEHIDAYRAAITQLARAGQLFDCNCSRRTLDARTIYPGQCRDRINRSGEPATGQALRLRISATEIRFTDLLFGPQAVDPQSDIGDFVIQRRDRIIAYALATAVDDGNPELTRVIRGRDLLEQTAVQLVIIDALGLSRPEYGHLPLIVNAVGQKLSKQTYARPVAVSAAIENLRFVLRTLGNAAAGMPADSPATLLRAAKESWSLQQVPLRDGAA